MNKLVQAKDITDEVLLQALAQGTARSHAHYGASGATRWEIEKALSNFPPKVVLAKLRSAVARGVIDGCACGCRGDFTRKVPDPCVFDCGHNTHHNAAFPCKQCGKRLDEHASQLYASYER